MVNMTLPFGKPASPSSELANPANKKRLPGEEPTGVFAAQRGKWGGAETPPEDYILYRTPKMKVRP